MQTYRVANFPIYKNPISEIAQTLKQLRKHYIHSMSCLWGSWDTSIRQHCEVQVAESLHQQGFVPSPEDVWWGVPGMFNFCKFYQDI